MASRGIGLEARRGPLVARVKTLINTQLKTILRSEGLPVSGTKAVLQERLINRIDHFIHNGDGIGFDGISIFVTGPTNLPISHGYPPPLQPSYGQGPGRPNAAVSVLPLQMGHASPVFKDSPFYQILEALTPGQELKVREITRDQSEVKFRLSSYVVDKLNSNASMRVMIYCASEPMASFSKADIAFPSQIEVRVNGDEVKSNFKGLKNKPGSTNPADITSLLRRNAHFENVVSVTYALTIKKYYMIVNLVRQYEPEALEARLRAGKSISEDQVVREMRSKGQDSDIVATSSIMSLKCPLSALRISTPCRSTICSHNECFDAVSFLQLQQQAPTWICPICNKIVSFQALLVDLYVDKILKSTSQSVDQVVIEPSGEWSPAPVNGLPAERKSTFGTDDNDDDDLVEIEDLTRIAPIKAETSYSIPMALRTPFALPAGLTSGTLHSASSSTAKRSHSEVIDLTLSSDDDAAPSAKRRAPISTHGSNIGLFGMSTGPIVLPPPNMDGLAFHTPNLASPRPSGSRHDFN